MSRTLVRTTPGGTKLVERPWACPRCGAHGVVARPVRRPRRWRRARKGPASPERLDEHWDVQHEATRMLAMIKCPVCLEHAPRVVLGSGLRLLGSMLSATVLAGLASIGLIVSGDIPVACLLLWLAGPFGLGAVREVGRWRAASRATVLRLRPGPPEEAELPRAVVHRLAAPPALVPVESSAPEPIEQADDASGPRFLHPE